MNNNKSLILTVVGLVTLIVCAVGGTYAYFTAQIGTGESDPTIKVDAGQLKINYANGNSVHIANDVQPTAATCNDKKPSSGGAYLCDQSAYTPVGVKNFTLTGTNTTDTTKNMRMPYNLILTVNKNEFSAGALKYSLVGTKEAGDTGSVVNIAAWKDLATTATATDIALGTGYFMPGTNKIHTYKLNIYFPDNHVPQDNDKNKTFSANIKVTTSEITK